MDEAMQICDRLVIVDHGRILALGTPKELVRQHAGAWALELRLDPEHQPAVLSLAGQSAENHEAIGDVLVCYVPGPTEAEDLTTRIREAGLPLESYQARPTTLEDVFLRLAGRSLQED
jgi:lipooligosaccharide transport system ATP-binding protein